MTIRAVLQGDPCLTEYALESTLFFAFYLAGHVSQELLQNIHPLEIIHKPCVLGFTFLQKVVFVEDGLQNDILLVEQAVDCRSIMKAESVTKYRSRRASETILEG